MRIVVWILIRFISGVFGGYHSHPPFYLTAAGLIGFGALACSLDAVLIENGVAAGIGACLIIVGVIMFVMLDLNSQD